MAFLGPYEGTYPWNPGNLLSFASTIRKIYNLREKVVNEKPTDEEKRQFHIMLKRLTSMMEDLKMNTAISEIMIFLNHVIKRESISKEIWLGFIKVIAPLTPFVAEELWQEANGFSEWKKENSVHLQEWPVLDESLAKEEEINLPVQINGKMRATILVPADLSEDEAKELAMKDATIVAHIKGKEIKKVIYIPNKILNFVLGAN